jgi:hypothetical protein
MSTSPSRLLLLLQKLAEAAPEIRRDLPGWYPQVLLPALQKTLRTIATQGATPTDCDLAVYRLADVLRRREETKGITNALALVPVGSDDRAMKPLGALDETIVLPDRLRNDIEVLLRKVIEMLPEPKESTVAPPASLQPPEHQ